MKITQKLPDFAVAGALFGGKGKNMRNFSEPLFGYLLSVI